MRPSERKIWAVFCLVLLFSLLLVGTFAWSSLNQHGLGEATGPLPTSSQWPIPSLEPTPTTSEEPTPTPTASEEPTPTPSEEPTSSVEPTPTPTASEQPTRPPDVPKTGDDRRPGLWLALGLTSLAGLLCCVCYMVTHRYRGRRILP